MAVKTKLPVCAAFCVLGWRGLCWTSVVLQVTQLNAVRPLLSLGNSSCFCFPGLCLWAANLLTIWHMICKWGWAEKMDVGLAFFIYFTYAMLPAYPDFFFLISPIELDWAGQSEAVPSCHWPGALLKPLCMATLSLNSPSMLALLGDVGFSDRGHSVYCLLNTPTLPSPQWGALAGGSVIPAFSRIPEDACLPHLPRTNAWEMKMSIKLGCHSNPYLIFAVNRKKKKNQPKAEDWVGWIPQLFCSPFQNAQTLCTLVCKD